MKFEEILPEGRKGRKSRPVGEKTYYTYAGIIGFMLTLRPSELKDFIESEWELEPEEIVAECYEGSVITFDSFCTIVFRIEKKHFNEFRFGKKFKLIPIEEDES